MNIKETALKYVPRDFCPVCEVRKLVHKTQLSPIADTGYGNGAALTPPMGWSSWNLFANKINEELLRQIADSLVASGLADCGYRFVNIDDCWESMSRDAAGKLQCDPITFPSGMRALTDYVNARGLKLGIYSSNGTMTCQNYPASLGYEAVDADTFAEWGVEYFKYDFCHNVAIPTLAPRISSVSVGIAHEGEILTLTPDMAKLSGRARIIRDGAQQNGCYIAGLCSRNGKAVFDNIVVPRDGEYILNFTAVTGRDKPEFALITINGTDKYRLDCPASRKYCVPRRDSITVRFKEGRNTVEIENPIGSKMDSAAFQYINMGLELKRATKEYAQKTQSEEKPITFSICEWGRNKPWKWGRQAGNLWRTTADICAKWVSVVGLYEINVRLWKYAAPGGWNDPDMLEVGVGDLSYEENKSHFTLWCMMAAPLILGNDIRKLVKSDGTPDTDSKVLQILTNRELIAVDQDAQGKQCRRIKRQGLVDYLVKPLENGEAAVCIFNKGVSAKDCSIDIQSIANEGWVDLPKAAAYTLRDLWSGETVSGVQKISASVPSHGVCVYRVSAVK